MSKMEVAQKPGDALRCWRSADGHQWAQNGPLIPPLVAALRPRLQLGLIGLHGRGFAAERELSAGREEPGYNDKVVARIPSGEWSDPEELAGAAIFLASSASKLITGVTIPIDGGYSAN